ncbi:disks large-associated protein 5 [Esox lucius]|uniref:Discs, large (Drosophila) homolog-associated protein 5 n=1 Tax=Esox lucius TaxID=8010 RepID=A0A3P8YPC7_ESOLU|nr:disks large-associated protein 5 [Esox lucius]
MEARFGYLRERDTSVDMLRVKLSRRRSRSQKENRDKALNIRRQLDKVPELECSQQDMSVGNVSIMEKKSNAKQARDAAVEERRKKLAHYKEKKELVKEKERREKEKKGVFKVGLYRAQPLASLPQVPAAATKARAVTAAQPQSTRVTRSTVRQQAPKVPQPISTVPVSKKGLVLVEPAAVRSTRKTRTTIVEPLVSAPSTRSANRPLASVIPVVRNKGATTTSNTKQAAAPPAGRGRNTRGNVENNNQAAAKAEKAKKETKAASPPPPIAKKKEDKMEDLAQANPLLPPATVLSSFAPQDFVFQAPAGLSSFKPTPLTPRSADSFFKPSFVLPPVPLWPTDDLVHKMELSAASSVKPVVHSPPRGPSLALLCPPSPQEPAHDLSYFRSVVVSEMEKLTGFCQLWELRVDDSSIPEEMRDRMRTAVGQARLLMKERFGQFTGLMDDCELGRGDKIITCTDLQGFWDMVYYQVEDVNKKFGALKEAESKGWQEESGPPPRPRKVVKKPPGAPVPKPAGGAAAKSRLAAIKAAIKAKQQAADAERASKVAGPDIAVEEPGPAPQEPPVVFQGGFFQVESPAKQTGSARRPSRVTATPTRASLCSVPKFFTPRMTRLSNAACSSPLMLTPACSNLSLTPSSPVQSSLSRVSPLRHVSKESQSEDGPSNQPEQVSGQNDQPEQDSMQEDVACDRSPLVTEPAVGLEESTESCDSERICQSTSNTQQLTNEQHQEAISQSVATEEPGKSDLLAMHEVSSPVAVQPDLPSPSTQDSEQAYHTKLPTSVSSNQSTSPSEGPLSPPCLGTSITESPPVQCHAFSLTVSHTPVCAGPTVASPPLVPSPPPGVSLCDSPGAGVPMTMTPDTSITGGLPGLDFELYLQPTARGSLSPQELGVAEMLSPAVVDIEMESPVSSSGGAPQDNVSSPTAVSNLAQMFTPRTTKPLSDLLLFTPDPMDRVRQSVCPSDLMSFTPPSNGL